MASDDPVALYLYGVLPDGVALPAVPGVEAVRWGGLQALMSPVSPDDWGPGVLGDPQRLEARVRHHDAVLQAVLPHCTPLPMRLGTLVRTSDDLTRWLARMHGSLAQLLSALAGRQEWGLKLTLTAAAITLPPTPPETDEPAGAGEGARYLRRKRREHAAARAAGERARALLVQVREQFAPLAEAWVTLPVRKECVTNEALLVPAELAPQLRAQCEAVNRKLAGTGSVALTGPWPPYSFVPCLFDAPTPSPSHA